jgi:hypothetical protein
VDDADLGRRLLKLLGEPACGELLAVLEWPEPERRDAPKVASPGTP